MKRKLSNTVSRAGFLTVLTVLIALFPVSPFFASAELTPVAPLSFDTGYLRGSLPRFDGDEAADALNAYYDLLSNSTALAIPAVGLDADEDSPVEVSYEIMSLSDRFASVLLTWAAGWEDLSVKADNFALDGLYAGETITLSQLLGLESDEEAEETEAAATVRELVWRIVSEESQNPDAGYPEGLTRDAVASSFDPEKDFYMLDDDNLVFFIQPGEIASVMMGTLRFPFATAELLDAVRSR